MGEENYILKSGMQPVDHHDKFGTLYIQDWGNAFSNSFTMWRSERRGLRPICRLKVINRSPEPDGTYRIYWLPINPDLYGGEAGRSAHAASASTWRTKPAGKDLFFEDWRDYDPRIET
jgi:hypothetical protein